MKLRHCAWACAASALALAWFQQGCGGDDCTPGRTTSCACPSGSGVQTCGDDGTFGACDCSDPSGPASSSSSSGGGGSGGMPTTSSSGGMGGMGGDGGSAPMCTAPEIACGGDCVNPLTDAMHCGGCDHDCLGEDCTGGFCPLETLAMNQPDVFALTLDSSDVYFSAADVSYDIKRVGKDGNGLTTVDSNEFEPRELALAGGVLFWANYGVGPNSGAIRQKTLPSGAASDLAGGLAVGVWGMAVSGDTVYFAHQLDSAVYKVSISAPAGEQLLASGQGRPWDIAADVTHVYWTNYDSGEVRRTVINGGQVPDVLANSQGNPLGIAIDATHVYWANETAGEIKRAPLAGGNEQLVASGQSGPTYLAIDGSHVYWTNFGNGTVARAPLAGGDVVRIAAGQNQPYHIALDDTHVYWSTLAGGTVMRTAK